MTGLASQWLAPPPRVPRISKRARTGPSSGDSSSARPSAADRHCRGGGLRAAAAVAGPGAEQAAAVDVVPSELIDRALAGDNDALAVLQAFLRGTDGKSPEAIARRATALIAQIGREKKDASTNSLLRVIDQIASNAINLVS